MFWSLILYFVWINSLNRHENRQIILELSINHIFALCILLGCLPSFGSFCIISARPELKSMQHPEERSAASGHHQNCSCNCGSRSLLCRTFAVSCTASSFARSVLEFDRHKKGKCYRENATDERKMRKEAKQSENANYLNGNNDSQFEMRSLQIIFVPFYIIQPLLKEHKWQGNLLNVTS